MAGARGRDHALLLAEHNGKVPNIQCWGPGEPGDTEELYSYVCSLLGPTTRRGHQRLRGVKSQSQVDLTSGPPPGHTASYQPGSLVVLTMVACVLSTEDLSPLPLTQGTARSPQGRVLFIGVDKVHFPHTQSTSSSKDGSLLSGQNEKNKKSFVVASENHCAWGGRRGCKAGHRTGL